MSDLGPPAHSDHWKEQVERMKKAFSFTEDKRSMEIFAMAYVLDRSYSRSAICQAMHDVEIEKGWR